jgi:hypothetical protein
MEHPDEEPLAYDEQTFLAWADGTKPITTREARDIERRLGLPWDGWTT